VTAVDILEAAESVGLAFRPAGGEFRACCPFCGDQKFHLYLNPRKNAWHCFRCGEGGGVRDLLQKMGKEPGERPRALHPVFRLTQDDMRRAGLRGGVDWRRLFERDGWYARACADWVWREFCEYERRRAQVQVVLLRALESEKEGYHAELQSRDPDRAAGPGPGPADHLDGDAGGDVLACG